MEEDTPPVIRVEEKILASLREQLNKGLITFEEYNKAAKGCVQVVEGEEDGQVYKPGCTLRILFRNGQKQMEAGLISEDDFKNLRRAAVHNKLGLPASPKKQQRSAEPVSKEDSSSLFDSDTVIKVSMPSMNNNNVKNAPSHQAAIPSTSSSKLPFVTEAVSRVQHGRKNSNSSDLPFLGGGGGSKSNSANDLPRLRSGGASKGGGSSKSSGSSKTPRSGRLEGPAPQSPVVKKKPKTPRGRLEGNVLVRTYTPFVEDALSREKSVRRAQFAEGISSAISLDLDCRIFDTVARKRKGYLGVSRTFICYAIKVTSRKGDLEFEVIRRYGEFYNLYLIISEIYSNIEFPILPKKSGFDNSDAELANRTAILLNDFLHTICSKQLNKSLHFIDFISPNRSPSLKTIKPEHIELEGWLAVRKLPSSLKQQITQTGFRRFYGVLCRGRLHLYADNERGDREPMMTRSVHMCSMEVRYSQQCGSNILEFDQWGAGKTYHLRPLPSNDEKLYQWVECLRKAHSKFVNEKVLRLLSEKEALKQSEAKEDEIRKASICIAGKIITEPSCNKTYYEKDKSSNVLIVDGVLKGGTPQKLVEKLLDPNICKPSTIVAFILTFHGFMSPQELLDQLLSYYKKSPSEKVHLFQRKQSASSLTSDQLRCVVVLQNWLQLNPQDFRENQTMLASVQSFANRNKLLKLTNILSNNFIKRLKNDRKPTELQPKICERLDEGRRKRRSNSVDKINPRMEKNEETLLSDVETKDDEKRSLCVETYGTVRIATKKEKATKRGVIPSFSPEKSSSKVKSKEQDSKSVRRRRANSSEVLPALTTLPPKLPSSFPETSWDLFSLDPVEVARQLSLHHFALFQVIKPSEFLNKNWSKEATKLRDSPHIITLIEKFNLLSGTVSTSIVRVKDFKERAGLLARWITISGICFNFNNYSGVMAIISGLLNSAIYRLGKTWETLKMCWPAQHTEFLKLSNVMSSDRNYMLLRGILKVVNPPVIPYLGVFLQDLTFCDDGNKDTIMLENVSCINFEKRVQISKIIQDIMLYQSVGYNFVEVSEIQAYFARFSPLNSEKLYARSLIIEPRTK